MYASAIPVAVSYFFLWNPPHWSHPALFLYLIVIAIIVRTFITMYEVPSSALIPELTDDYDQRTSFVAYRYFFGVAGAGRSATSPARYLLTPDATASHRPAQSGRLRQFGLVAAGDHGRDDPDLGSAARIAYISTSAYRLHGGSRSCSTLKEMASSLSHPHFGFLMGASLFGTMAIGLSRR